MLHENILFLLACISVKDFRIKDSRVSCTLIFHVIKKEMNNTKQSILGFLGTWVFHIHIFLQVHQATVRELEHLKIKHRESLSELETLRDKSQCLEMERIQTEQTLGKFKEMLQKQKKENQQLQGKVEELVQLKADLKR